MLYSTEHCTILNTQTLYLVSNAMLCFKYIAFLHIRQYYMNNTQHTHTQMSVTI